MCTFQGLHLTIPDGVSYEIFNCFEVASAGGGGSI